MACPESHRHCRLLAADEPQIHSLNHQRGESGVIGVGKASEVGHELTRSLVRDLVNKLAVVVGYCDLLSEHLMEGSRSATHLGAIHELAQKMAKELKEYQCRS